MLAGLAAALGTIAGFALAAVRYGRIGRRLRTAEGRLANYEQFVEQSRELVWQHRDIAPELATIVLDEITRFTNTDRRREITP